MNTHADDHDECACCGRILKIRALGLCNACYIAALERKHPGTQAKHRAYMREYNLKNTQDCEVPCPKDIIRAILYPPLFTIEDWLSFIVQGRKRNKRMYPEKQSGPRNKYRRKYA